MHYTIKKNNFFCNKNADSLLWFVLVTTITIFVLLVMVVANTNYNKYVLLKMAGEEGAGVEDALYAQAR